MTELTTLENGLRIVTEKANFNNVCLSVTVKVGMRNEPNELNGISHFLEHMAFKGTKTKTAKELINDLEFYGANCNAYTADDHTSYLVNCLPQDWKMGVDFLADIILNSVFPEDELEKERNVILQEKVLSEDDPNTLMWDTIGKTVFEGQPVGRTILGTMENIKKISREDLIKYMNDGYVANKMIISACGNLDHEEFVKYISEKFNNLNTEFKLDNLKAEYKKANNTISTKFDQARVVLLYDGITKKDIDLLAIRSVYDSILDGGMSSRLFQNVRENNGLGYAVASLDGCYEDTGYSGVFVALDKNDIEKAKNILIETVESMSKEISEKELQKAKNSIIYNLSTRFDSCNRLMSKNTYALLYDNEIKTFEQLKSEIESITTQDVINFSKKILENGFSLIVLD